MDYRKFGTDYVIRLDPGDEILESLMTFAENEKVHLGSVSGLGASTLFDVSVYDLGEKKYYPVHCGVQSEITSLFGTITEKDGKPYFHVHMQAMTKDGRAVGGHLLKCVINATCEMFVHVLDGHVDRAVSGQTGLTVMKF